jgi:hypothetical protein
MSDVVAATTTRSVQISTSAFDLSIPPQTTLQSQTSSNAVVTYVLPTNSTIQISTPVKDLCIPTYTNPKSHQVFCNSSRKILGSGSNPLCAWIIGMWAVIGGMMKVDMW